MAITAPGVGSNLDVNSIISQLMAVEQRPLGQLGVKEAAFQSKLSAVGQVKSAVGSIQAALGGLKDASRFSGIRATSSDTKVVAASADKTASPGTYAVEVTTLAQAQKLHSKAFSAATTVVGSGTLTLQFGTESGGVFTANADRSAIAITVDGTNNTLAGIRDAINAKKAGITATIVNDGSGYRLALSSAYAGANHEIKVAVSDVDGNPTDDAGLSQLAHDPVGVQRLTESQAAQNALFKIDGITVSQTSNTVTNAIDGLTLTLTTAGSSTVTVTRDATSAKSAIDGFVKAYNEAQKTLSALGAYNAETKQAGALQGDSTLRTIQTQVRSILTGSLPNAGGGLNLLSQIGLSFELNGTLKLDASKLQAAIDDPTKDVATLFAAVGKPSDPDVRFTSSSSKTQSGVYALSVSQLATRGTVTASSLLGGNVQAGVNDALSLTVDGKSAAVTLTAGNYSAAALAAEIQSKLNGALSSQGATVEVAATGTGGSTAGSAIANLTIDGTNNSLSVTLNGITQAVTLTQATYASAADLAAHVQSQINAAFSGDGLAVTVTQSGGTLTIAAANSFGTGSTTTVAGAGANDLLGAGRTDTAGTTGTLTIASKRYGSESTLAGFSINASLVTPASVDTSAAAGVDVAGSIGSALASGKGQTLTGAGNAEALALTISGGATGSRGEVAYDRGFAVLLDDYLTQVLGTSGTIAARTDGINASIKGLGRQREVLQQRLIQIEARYRRQFTALDTLVASMNKTSSYLQQQLANLPKAGG